MMSDTLDKKLDSKLDAFTAAIASSVQTVFSAIQTSLDTVNTNVNGLTNKVDNLFLDMGKQQQVTTESKGKVSTLEHGFLELTQTVAVTNSHDPIRHQRISRSTTHDDEQHHQQLQNRNRRHPQQTYHQTHQGATSRAKNHSKERPI
jgi:hypothetical protein